MKRRQLVVLLLAGIAFPAHGLAQTAEDQVIDQLKRQGYRRIILGRTLLGRTRIVATGPRGRREIILNPSTGAILRDYVDRSDRGGNGNDDRDADRDDRDDDLDDDDDDDRDDDRDDREDDDRDDDRDDEDDDDDDDGGGGDDDDDD